MDGIHVSLDSLLLHLTTRHYRIIRSEFTPLSKPTRCHIDNDILTLCSVQYIAVDPATKHSKLPLAIGAFQRRCPSLV